MIASDTKIVTASQGIAALGELPGAFTVYHNKESHTVIKTLTHQAVDRLTFQTNHTPTAKTWEVFTPHVNPWNTKGLSDLTYDIRVSDIVPGVIGDQGYDAQSWIAGVLSQMGDPNGALTIRGDRLSKHMSRIRELATRHKDDKTFWFGFNTRPTRPLTATGDSIGSFIRGVVSTTKRYLYTTTDTEQLKFFVENAAVGGFIVTGNPISRRTYLGKGADRKLYDVYNLSFQSGVTFDGFRLKSVEKDVKHVDCYTLHSTTPCVSTSWGLSCPVDYVTV